MKNYRHPSFFSHIPAVLLYDCMLGRGSIYRVGQEFIMYTSDYRQPLGCGCPGSKLVKIIDQAGNKIYQELTCEEKNNYKGKAEEHISFQEAECQPFWENLYKEHPAYRPLAI